MAQRGRPTKFNKPINAYESPKAAAKAEPVNFDLLSDEEKAAIRAKAEERVLQREKERAEEAYLELETLRFEKERNPAAFEEQRTITIDLALYADRVTLD